MTPRFIYLADLEFKALKIQCWSQLMISSSGHLAESLCIGFFSLSACRPIALHNCLSVLSSSPNLYARGVKNFTKSLCLSACPEGRSVDVFSEVSKSFANFHWGFYIDLSLLPLLKTPKTQNGVAHKRKCSVCTSYFLWCIDCLSPLCHTFIFPNSSFLNQFCYVLYLAESHESIILPQNHFDFLLFFVFLS